MADQITAINTAMASDEEESDGDGDDEVLEMSSRWSEIRGRTSLDDDEDEDDEGEDGDEDMQWRRRRGGGVMLEGYIEGAECGGGDGGDDEGSEDVARTKSLTDDDLEELKGCVDLGFGFSYDEIPELRNTLPALELCYSMSQRFLDEQRTPSLRVSAEGDEAVGSGHPPSHGVASWKFASPGDNPDEVKARLKYWAQAVACTVRLCN